MEDKVLDYGQPPRKTGQVPDAFEWLPTLTWFLGLMALPIGLYLVNMGTISAQSFWIGCVTVAVVWSCGAILAAVVMGTTRCKRGKAAFAVNFISAVLFIWVLIALALESRHKLIGS